MVINSELQAQECKSSLLEGNKYVCVCVCVSVHPSSGWQDCDPIHVQLYGVNAEVSQTLKETSQHLHY